MLQGSSREEAEALRHAGLPQCLPVDQGGAGGEAEERDRGRKQPGTPYGSKRHHTKEKVKGPVHLPPEHPPVVCIFLCVRIEHSTFPESLTWRPSTSSSATPTGRSTDATSAYPPRWAQAPSAASSWPRRGRETSWRGQGGPTRRRWPNPRQPCCRYH